MLPYYVSTMHLDNNMECKHKALFPYVSFLMKVSLRIARDSQESWYMPIIPTLRKLRPAWSFETLCPKAKKKKRKRKRERVHSERRREKSQRI
jgi:hypothetical protein